MILRLSERFRKSYTAAPPEVQKAFDKQSLLLSRNLHYPSLRAKKYDEKRGVWQARVNRDWRFYFTMETGAYVVIGLTRHPK
jgi:plasmid maintenance system killer protein